MLQSEWHMYSNLLTDSALKKKKQSIWTVQRELKSLHSSWSRSQRAIPLFLFKCQTVQLASLYSARQM